MNNSRTAVLLINTGSPDAPTAEAVRRYLAEFLGDPRVVELPRWKWWPILHGIILRVRPAKSALRYQGVWTEEGSPLVVHTRRTAEALAKRFSGDGVAVYWAMRYGNPSVKEVFARMRSEGVERVLAVPMFAQYAPQTTAACWDAVAAVSLRERDMPAIRQMHDWHRDPAYIGAVVSRIRQYWEKHGSAPAAGGRLMISFHGLPKRGIELGDVYRTQCETTAAMIAAELGLSEGQWLTVFQSRFGRDEWLQPYALPAAQTLGKEKLPRLDVVCPGFAADCLETIEEIDDELRNAFVQASGGTSAFHYIPALNDSVEAIDAYEQMFRRELAGWL